MRKACFFLSAIVHALGITLLIQIRFPIKIALTSPAVITISLQQPEATLPETLLFPDSPGRGNHGQAPSLLSGSGSINGASPSSRSSPLDGPPAGGVQINSYNFLSSGRLQLKSPPSSTFNLTLSAPQPFAASTLSAKPRTGKWFQPGGVAASAYPDGIRLNDSGPPGGNRLSRMPFPIQDKETALWTQNILARIERNWIIPTVTRVGFTGQVEITLTINHNGNLLSLIVAKSSSQEALDQAALNALQASLPFPPLPENISAETFVFHFLFTYNV